jgi:hypothetical protein
MSSITTYEQAIRRRVKRFTGRQGHLQEMQKFFAGSISHSPRVLILQAMGGQGKSQLALEYCRLGEEMYRDIFWVNASSKAAAVQSLVQIAVEVQLSLAGVNDVDVQIRMVLRDLEQRKDRWLMVLDNYDDPQAFADLDRFLPSRKSGHVGFVYSFKLT